MLIRTLRETRASDRNVQSDGWESARLLLKDDGMGFSMHVTTLNAGLASHAPHTHPNEEVVILKEGRLEVFANGETRVVGPGAVMFMASNQPHAVRNVGDVPATYHVINWRSAPPVAGE